MEPSVFMMFNWKIKVLHELEVLDFEHYCVLFMALIAEPGW